MLTCFLAGGVRNEVIGFGKASKVRAPFSHLPRAYSCSQCVWALSQLDIWGQFLIIDYNTRACLCGPWREVSSWRGLDSTTPEAANSFDLRLQVGPEGRNTGEAGRDFLRVREAIAIANANARDDYFTKQSTYPASQAPMSPHSSPFWPPEFNSSHPRV
jgi:hypothetical protein